MASEGQDRADALGWGRRPNRPKTFARTHTTESDKCFYLRQRAGVLRGVAMLNFALKLSEKGYEQCSERGFGRRRKAKKGRKDRSGALYGYTADSSDPFRTVLKWNSRKSISRKLHSPGPIQQAVLCRASRLVVRCT
jgi:hypothetical protein